MNFYILTLFPEMIEDGMKVSILGRAKAQGTINVKAVNIRDYSLDKHKRVDDYPYGGGAGMVMGAESVVRCVEAVLTEIAENEGKSVEEIKEVTPVVYMTPWGRPFKQKIAEQYSKLDNLVILCGHYEGIDERALEICVTDFVSAGDFVLTGGELPAMMIVDATSRLIDGVLHNNESFVDESFSNDLLEYPQYTRPEEFRGLKVPEVLLSGHHANIRKWRDEQSLKRTETFRPDLLKK